MSEHLKLSEEELVFMNAALVEYDVDQDGWEHEQKGFEFNVNHALKELVRARRKDLYDAATACTDLAPDAMQYALRLARWNGFSPSLVLPTAQTEALAEGEAAAKRFGVRRLGAYAASELILVDFVHKLDHDSERGDALAGKFDSMTRAAQTLTLFALDTANEFRFSLPNAFYERLSELRRRFNIPMPIQEET